jgi:hypothetical protein
MRLAGKGSVMKVWLKKQWLAFRAWMQRNQEAHASAPDQACCSSPPPGAGRPDGKGV